MDSRRYSLRPTIGRLIPVLLISGLVLGGCDDTMFRNIVYDIFSGVGFEDLNIVNGTTEEVSGSFVVARLDGEQMFEKQFRVKPGETGPQLNLSVEDDRAVTTYGGVFSEAGSYDISATLDNPIGGSTALRDTVEITKPDEQHVLVVLDASERPPIRALRIPQAETEENAQ